MKRRFRSQQDHANTTPEDAAADSAFYEVDEATESGDEAFYEVDENTEASRRLGVATDLDRARIRPWIQLPQEEFLVEEEKLADLAQNRILKNLEQFGISLIRLLAHEASAQLVGSIIEMIGTPTEFQNKSVGRMKDIRPQPDISTNTGDS